MSIRILACLAVISLPSATQAESLWVGKFNTADTAIPAPWKIEHLDPSVPPT